MNKRPWWKSALMFIIVAPLLINVVVRSYVFF